MKKVILSLVTIAVLGVITVWLIGSSRTKEASQREWPANLGTLDQVPNRYPPAEQSAGATRLVQIASGANIDLKPRVKDDISRRESEARRSAVRKDISEYIKTQFERSGDAIDAPPPIVAEYLASHAVPLDDTRDHLLSGNRIEWETKVTQGFDMPIPNLLGHMDLHRALMARAFDKARNNDPTAWNDLRASWELNRGLWNRPDLISILIALATTRMSNAAARKMPLPAPQWFDEVRSYDYLGAMAASQQAEAWAIANTKPGRMHWKDYLFLPLTLWQEGQALMTIHDYTTESVRANACDVDSKQFATARASFVTDHFAVPNLLGAWQRMMRFRAEREATDRILQIRAGQTPSATSVCSDGMWQVTANSIRFSRDVKVPPPGIRYPLEYTR